MLRDYNDFSWRCLIYTAIKNLYAVVVHTVVVILDTQKRKIDVTIGPRPRGRQSTDLISADFASSRRVKQTRLLSCPTAYGTLLIATYSHVLILVFCLSFFITECSILAACIILSFHFFIYLLLFLIFVVQSIEWSNSV